MDRKMVALAVSAALCAGPANAQLLMELFPGSACYAREYTSTHMASRPAQQVRAIFLRQPDEGGMGYGCSHVARTKFGRGQLSAMTVRAGWTAQRRETWGASRSRRSVRTL